MAARWKISCGRLATSFSASPGVERSETSLAPSKGTTSCRISSPAPSFFRRAVSLRPIMPAAPITRAPFTGLSPVRIPDAPPRRVALVAAHLEVAAVGEVGAHHAVSGVAQVVHAERVVGLDQHEDRLFERGSIG